MKIQCDVCSKDEASVFCSADEAALCEGCDERVHHANKLATKHIRFSLLLPSSSNQSESRPLCDICQYCSMASNTAELSWLTFLFRDIGVSLTRPPQLFCDNVSALHLSINPMFHARTKHIELDYHFVREKVAMGHLTTRYIPSSAQPADLFTKALPKISFTSFQTKLGVHDPSHSNLRGGFKESTSHGTTDWKTYEEEITDGERRAILFCQEDRAILCSECDIPIHKANEHTLKHNRFLLTGVKLSCPSSSSSSSSNGFDLPTYSHIKSSVISNQSSNPTSSIHYDKASLPSTNTTPCKANHDHDHHYRYVSQENSVSLSTSSISEYLMETLPGWRVDDFLDPSCFPHGFCKFSNHDLDKGWYPFPSEDLVICVPQAPIQSSHNTPLCPPQTGVINGVFKGSEEELDLMKFSRKWNEDGFTVPQISPPLKKSRQFW
ncbi:unnamed protein product [Camellia sinensis]